MVSRQKKNELHLVNKVLHFHNCRGRLMVAQVEELVLLPWWRLYIDPCLVAGLLSRLPVDKSNAA